MDEVVASLAKVGVQDIDLSLNCRIAVGHPVIKGVFRKKRKHT